jgi:hypothetical protein
MSSEFDRLLELSITYKPIIIKCRVCKTGTTRATFYRPSPSMCMQCGHTFTQDEHNASVVMHRSRYDIVFPRYGYRLHGKKWMLVELQYDFPIRPYPSYTTNWQDG